MALVLVDGENVRRSVWPNISRDDLEARVARWADAHGHDAVVVWETDESADDTIARDVRQLEPPLWVVTSDRELRRRVEPYVERTAGGGSFARELASYESQP